MTPQPQAHPTLGTPIMKGTWAPITQAFSLAPPLEPLQPRAQAPPPPPLSLPSLISTPSSPPRPSFHQHLYLSCPPASAWLSSPREAGSGQRAGDRVSSCTNSQEALSHTKLTAVRAFGRCGWGGSRGRALLGGPWDMNEGEGGLLPPAPACAPRAAGASPENCFTCCSSTRASQVLPRPSSSLMKPLSFPFFSAQAHLAEATQ